jgi:ubiquinone/menaquinone biosynthesis C-methylase UbiE
MRRETREVKDFYDNLGWTKRLNGQYIDADAEDNRPVSREYIHRCHQRVKRFLPSRGNLLLDCASGAVQFKEYQEYSTGFTHRVCVDISTTALIEARKKLGPHGLYVIADAVNLPFRADQFDAVISLHTIYHIPSDLQLQAFSELYRVAGINAPIIVVYTVGPFSPLNRLLILPVRALRLFKTLPQRLIKVFAQLRAIFSHNQPAQPVPMDGHFYPYDFNWINQRVISFYDGAIYSWRSISVPSMRGIIHSWLGGKLWLKLLFVLEDHFPYFFARVGQYPLIVIRKTSIRR